MVEHNHQYGLIAQAQYLLRNKEGDEDERKDNDKRGNRKGT